jgi:hypothetical protein
MIRSAIAVCLAGIVGTAQAQMISGRVTDQTLGTPVAGVVVSALDANGATLARAVSDSASGFRITIGAGATKLRFRRIGYSPATVALADSANGRIDVVLIRLPTQLPVVKAVENAQCEDDANGGDALALWDQTRSGMLTSIVARESKAAWLSILTYTTSFDGDDEEPRSVDRVELASASNAFLAGGQADSLAKYGYGITNLFGTTYLAPDDVVLFDDSFLATHCFRLGQSGDSTIALDFEPAKGRNNLIEIAGTVLFRRDPLDVKSVVYRYTGVGSSVEKMKPGGAFYFERMPSGITMIQRWHIRGAIAMSGSSRSTAATPTIIPGATRRGPFGRPVPARAPTIGQRVELQAVENGALIELMQWPNTPPFVAPLATISGVLIDKYTKRPLPFTPIRFYRTPYRATTDSTGAYSLVDVLPGVYEIDAGDFELERYGAAPDLIGPVTVRYGANKVNLDGEGPQAAAVRGCSDKMEGRIDMPKQLAGRNAIFGMITPETRPPREIDFTAEVIPAGAVAGTTGFPLKGKTDRFGRFRICSLPAGTVKLTSRMSGLYGADTLVVDPLHPYRLVTLKLTTPAGPQQ